jgi:hypothetical protein
MQLVEMNCLYTQSSEGHFEEELRVVTAFAGGLVKCRVLETKGFTLNLENLSEFTLLISAGIQPQGNRNELAPLVDAREQE